MGARCAAEQIISSLAQNSRIAQISEIKLYSFDFRSWTNAHAVAIVPCDQIYNSHHFVEHALRAEYEKAWSKY